MRIHKTAFYAVQILFFVLAPLVFAGFIYGLLHMSSVVEVSESKIHAERERLKASAQVYYNRLQMYDGMCQDIGVNRPFRCNESLESYAIETRLESGEYYCFDSANFAGPLPRSIGENVSCR